VQDVDDLQAALDIPQYVAVAEQDAFCPSGGARGIDNGGECLTRQIDRGRLLGSLFRQLVVDVNQSWLQSLRGNPFP
jgi:hypothetical protein